MTRENEKELGNAKIYVVGNPEKINKVLTELQSRCGGVDFVGGDATLNIQRMKELKAELDGILVFGTYLDRELGSIGLPTIMVKDLWSWEKGIQRFYRDYKVLTTCLSETDLSPSISSQRLDDLTEKTKLIVALSKVKKSRLLDITHQETIQPCDQRDSKPSNYDESYPKILKELFGLEVVKISFESLNKEIECIEAKEAEEIADRWINEAQKVSNTTREHVVKSAKMYLAVVKLMQQYNANSVTMSGWSGFADGKIDAFPCLGNTELSKKLIPNNCESLIDALVTEMLGIYIMGRPGFVGDTVVDPLNGVIIWGHCKCPINPHGDDRVPYIIRSHALQKWNRRLPEDYPEAGSTLSAVVQVRLPTDEAVTAVKLSLYERKIALSTGVSVPGRGLYTDFDDILCRTKLVMKTDTEAFERKYDTVTFGVHRNIIYGDHRERFKDLAVLLGYEVVEEMSSTLL